MAVVEDSPGWLAACVAASWPPARNFQRMKGFGLLSVCRSVGIVGELALAANEFGGRD